MDLPNLFSSSAKIKAHELVLFVLLSDVTVQVSLLELSKHGVTILDTSKEFEYSGLDSCVEQTDLALQQLAKQSESVAETVFAVNTSWVQNGEVVVEKKPFVKRLTDDLSLKPLGFIDISESMAQQKLDENTLFSGILVVFTKTELLFSLLHQGTLKATEIVGSSADFQSDFSEGLARIKKSIERQGAYLPPQVFLISLEYSQAELHEYQQQIYEQNWEEAGIFLQTPVVSVVSRETIVQSLAREAGKNASLQKGRTDFAIASSLGGAVIQAQTDQENLEELDSTELGFSDALEENVPTSFGIPIKQHVVSENLAFDQEFEAETKNSPIGVGKTTDSDSLFAIETPNMVQNQNSEESDKRNQLDLKSTKKDWGHAKNRKWFAGLGFVLGVLVLIAGIVLSSTFFTKTELYISLDKKPISKDIELTLDTNSQGTNVEELRISADTITRTASGKHTMQTTGIKIVGEKAKGTVSIYNKTGFSKHLEKGTKLRFGDLVFLTDDAVTVASASAQQGGEQYGKAMVAVTADAIGAESNIGKDTELRVESYDTDTYNAYTSEGSLQGGSSREVRVVVQKDLDTLKKDLQAELLQQVNDVFAEESGNGRYILPSKSIIQETAKYSAQIDTEVESVSLELEIEVEALTYEGSDLKPVAQAILSQELPEKYQLVADSPQILSSASQTDLDALESEAVVMIQAQISSFAVPMLTESEIREQIIGKSFAQAKEILEAKEEIKSVEFAVVPSALRSFVRKIPSSVGALQIKFVE